jgi:AAHS family 3-hydroxyphenylpropionic acid transporter
MLGAAIGGRTSDLIGRKWVLITAVSIFGLLTVATALSTSAHMLQVTRFLTGVGLGGALPNLIALVSESVSYERRSTAMGCLYASLPTGGAVASLITSVASAKGQWPIVYLIGGIAPLLLVPLLLLNLPNRGLAPAAATAPKIGIANALFGEGRAARTLVLWIGFFLALLTMYLLLGWLPSLMVSRGLTRPQASIVQLAFNAFGAVGSVLTGLLLDRGRRAMTIGLVFAAALACIAFLAGIPPQLALATLAGGLMGATVSGTQTILYALAPSCYPSKVRGTGVGFAVAIGRFGSAAGPMLGGILVGNGRSPADVMAALLPILGSAGVAAIVVALSTKASDRSTAVVR